ncbi:MAG TPA: hypothetical protein VK760_13360, partial [Candidatus Acidoferrales bacterium]|nr:hypothetical protein [Candidatus Acidoferrales bacterium]
MTTGNDTAARGAAWNALQDHHKKIGDTHLRDLFAQDSTRGTTLALDAAGVYLDYSKNRITQETVGLLVALAKACGLRERIDAMFAGEKINVSENRAVLHVALRAPKGEKIVTDGQDVVPDVHAVLDKMAAFSERVRSGAWTG